MWDLWVTRCHSGRFSPSTLSLANYYSPAPPHCSSSTSEAVTTGPLAAGVGSRFSLTPTPRIIMTVECQWQECLRAGYNLLLWPYCPFLGLGGFFSFLILYTVGMTPWTGDQPVVRPLPTHRTTQTQNKRKQTSMPWVGDTIRSYKYIIHISDIRDVIFGLTSYLEDENKFFELSSCACMTQKVSSTQCLLRTFARVPAYRTSIRSNGASSMDTRTNTLLIRQDVLK
jgi:hypothetical protein